MDWTVLQREEKVKELAVLLKVFSNERLNILIRDKAESAINKLINELYNYRGDEYE